MACNNNVSSNKPNYLVIIILYILLAIILGSAISC